jgi:hypothetical protein
MSIKDTVKREADSASEKLHEASDEAKRQAKGLVAEAQEAASQYVDEGKQAAAGHLTSFAQAVRRASDELAQNDQGVAARLVTEAADGLEKVANSVSGATIDDMVSSVTSFARRNPGAFVIGAVLAGVALGRFVKASAERPRGYGDLPHPRGTGSAGYPGSYPGPRGMDSGRQASTGSGSMNYPGATRGTTYPAGARPTGAAMPAGGTNGRRVGPASTPQNG